MTFDSEKLKEWKQMWPLPFVAMFGVAGSGVFTYASGVFMDEMVGEFGWSRGQYTSAMLATLVVVLTILPLAGRAVDRFGPRKVALWAIIPAALGPSVLGLANGNIWQWWLLAIVQAIPVVVVVPTLWLTAIVGRFNASRGLAVAVTLSGAGLGTGLWPLLAGFYIQWFGWRLAWGAVGLTWGLLMMPLAIFFFFDVRDTVPKPKVRVKAPPYAHFLKSRTFIFLTLGGVAFQWCSGSLTVHMVPMLRAGGLTLTMAAGLAGLMGLCSIAGRIGVGFLLDILRTRPFSMVIFLLPMAVCLLLYYAQGSFAMAVLAVMLLGFAMGAELDIVAYLASRRFPHAVFGSIYSVFQTVTAVGSVSGSVIAGLLFDWWGSYMFVLMVLPPLSLLASVLIGMIPDAKQGDVPEGTPVPDEHVPAVVQVA